MLWCSTRFTFCTSPDKFDKKIKWGSFSDAVNLGKFDAEVRAGAEQGVQNEALDRSRQGDSDEARAA